MQRSSQHKLIPIITKYEYFRDLAFQSNKIMEQNFRQTLKEILYGAYHDNNDLFGENIVNTGLGLIFHNNENVKNHIVSVQARRENEKHIILDRMAGTSHKIDLMKTKDLVKTISLLHEKGVMKTIEFIESVNVSK